MRWSRPRWLRSASRATAGRRLRRWRRLAAARAAYRFNEFCGALHLARSSGQYQTLRHVLCDELYPAMKGCLDLLTRAALFWLLIAASIALLTTDKL